MNEAEQERAQSIELAKAGFENAQDRIVAIDTKVGIAVGVLGLLIPAPLVVVAWLTGLADGPSQKIFGALDDSLFVSIMLALFMLVGVGFAFFAIVKGISALSPRTAKGYGRITPFHNEWRPNVLFPMHQMEKAKEFDDHVQKLKSGVGLSFTIDEYAHQLEQLGRILHEKCTDMKSCFWGLRGCLFCYGLALCAASGIIAIAALTQWHR
jgi:hypothetical protein